MKNIYYKRSHAAIRWIAWSILASLVPTFVTAAESFDVQQWGTYEMKWQGPQTGNPFLEISLSARFSKNGTTLEASGFYDGEVSFCIRFMPPSQGLWRYTTQSNSPALDGKTGTVIAGPPRGNNHGPVRVANTFHFAYRDGTPYKQMGTTCYAWIHQDEALQETTLKTLEKSPFNKIRFCVFPKRYSWNTNEPKLYPFM